MSGNFRADLHVHSSCSDGTDSPLELLSKAKAAGLLGLSITDHDTIAAYTPELMQAAEQIGLQLLIGTEISSEMEGSTVHILAYAFDHKLSEFLELVVQRRIERNKGILEKLNKKGMGLSLEEIGSGMSELILGRLHIAEAMVRRGYVTTVREAFNRYLKDDACCYVIGGKFHPREVIEAIHRARGKAVIAHPHFLKRGRFQRELLNLPFDGIECYYGRCLKGQELPWLEIARKRTWIATGGSDYHGLRRFHIQLGCSWVGLSTWQKLIA